MSRILSIDALSLENEGLDYETIDLGTTDFQSSPLSLEAGSMHSVACSENRLSTVEGKVAELESHGNVRYDGQQNLTEEEQERARVNIGVNASGETDPIFTRWWLNDYEEMTEFTVEELDRLLV